MNWIREPLSDIYDTTSGGTPSRKVQEYYQNGTIPWVKSGELENNIILDTEEYITEEALANSSAKIFPAGTLLIALYGATIGKLAFLGIPAATNQAVCAIFENKKVSLKYLYYYLLFKRSDLVKQGIGGAQPNISQAILKKLIIPYPVSISDQERIVARIEELFSQLDAGVETLKKIKQQLTVYRRSVLSDAFEGRMTAQWREKNCKNTEDLVRTARNKRDSILSSKRLKKLKYEWKEDIELPNIPREWEYAQIGDVAWEIKDGPHYSPEYVDEGIPFITGGNVRPSGVDFDNAKRISPELHKELSRRCRPEKGDMLYTKGGTTGIARVNTYDHEFSVWVHVAVIKYVDSVLPAYFQYVLNSPLCYQQSQKYTHGVGNQDLGLTRMINIIFPLCDVEEQKEIVRELESRLSVCDSIEKTVDEALQQSAAMRQSILKQEFNY